MQEEILSQQDRHLKKVPKLNMAQRAAIAALTAVVAGGVIAPLVTSAAADDSTWTNIAVDTYSRTVTNGFGSADLVVPTAPRKVLPRAR